MPRTTSAVSMRRPASTRPPARVISVPTPLGFPRCGFTRSVTAAGSFIATSAACASLGTELAR